MFLLKKQTDYMKEYVAEEEGVGEEGGRVIGGV